MFKGTIIKPNCDIITINISDNSIENVVSIRGYGTIKNIHIWKFETLEVILLGWDTGHHSKINKFELPEPLENKILYGDIVLLMKENGDYIDFSTNDFNDFYEEMMGDFDSCNSNDDTDLENDEYDFDDDFIENDL